ncbi:MAG: hypothetical protein AVDCRST_MAG89-4350, partial [uncultured Gemmatimonadetes bacterium]
RRLDSSIATTVWIAGESGAGLPQNDKFVILV